MTIQHARKNQVGRQRQGPGANARRSKGEIHHSRKSRTAKASAKRSRARLETDRCASQGRDSEASYGQVLDRKWGFVTGWCFAEEI